jgi:hypothetical protein
MDKMDAVLIAMTVMFYGICMTYVSLLSKKQM